jgi:L-aspartate oxidase
MIGRYIANFDTRQLPQIDTEVLIIGAGIAGLFSAWSANQAGAQVTVITKQALRDSNTYKAQGGIAAAVGGDDSPELHLEDTLVAGDGLCRREGVKILVSEGVRHVRKLMEIGVPFDSAGKSIALAREGCHSRARVLHAGGDATGAQIVDTLTAQIKNTQVTVLEQRHLVDLLVHNQTCYGALVWDEAKRQLQVFRSRVVILATGGIGQLYQHTTNPEGATGDGIAAAYRAGAEVMDMEFVQFHPTALALEGVPSFLISEAVRGEGALLYNAWRERFMPDYHRMAELAPRDVVTRAMFHEMNKTNSRNVYLDVTHLDPERMRARFPGINATCMKYGIDMTSQWIPVAPAAHYMMGGVKINLWGETSVERLFCCGEAGCTGIHGANRLASNSLLEGLVMGDRIARRSVHYRKTGWAARNFMCDTLLPAINMDHASLQLEIKNIMEQYVGPLRTGQGLLKAEAWFENLRYWHSHEAGVSGGARTRNMLTVAELITEAAISRTESRGGHFRQDFPEKLARWQRHLILQQ